MDWKKYENDMINKHIQLYSHKTWHWSAIPEIELYNSGYIIDHTEHRMKRLQQTTDINFYTEYGLDGLSYDGLSYHGIQVKCYSKKVTSKHIGSFQSVIFNRLQIKDTKSKGYLYTTSSLQNDLENEIKHSNRIIHHKIPYKTTPIIQSNEVDIRNLETRHILHPYQQEATDFLIQTRKKIRLLNIFCAGGKTTITGKTLQIIRKPIIICIAPLKSSVDNLTRIHSFIPDYTLRIIDSDDGNTTSEEEISELLTQENILLCVTYKSFPIVYSLIRNFLEVDLVVDEIHNIINRPEISDLINQFPYVIGLSATIPEELYEILEIEDEFTYSLSDAIQNKYCVNYTIWFPFMNDGNIVCDLTYDYPFLHKVCFLITGMLETGSRRCIVYVSSIEECTQFTTTFEKICKDYHGVRSWTSIINCNTSQLKRKQYLEEFQNDKQHLTLHIIVCISILNESIDCPRCDSECIVNISENMNAITFVQRLQRGGRIDTYNHSKHNNMFICSDYQESMSLFTLLREHDPEFHTKIRINHSVYGNNIREKDEVQEKMNNVVDIVKIGIQTIEQLWERKLEQVKEYIDNYKERPSIISKDLHIKKLGSWIHHQQYNYKTNIHSMKILKIKLKYEAFIREYQEYFLTREEKWYIKLNEVKLYIKVNRKLPTRGSKNIDIKKLGKWLSNQIKYYKNNQCYMKNLDIKLKYESFTREYEEYFITWEEKWFVKLNQVKLYMNEYKKRPFERSKDSYIKNIGIWLTTQQHSYKNNIECMKKSNIKNNYEDFLREYQEYFITREEKWYINFEKLKLYMKEHKKQPSQVSKDFEIAWLGKWWSEQKTSYKKNKNSMKNSDIKLKYESFTREYQEYLLTNK